MKMFEIGRLRYLFSDAFNNTLSLEHMAVTTATDTLHIPMSVPEQRVFSTLLNAYPFYTPYDAVMVQAHVETLQEVRELLTVLDQKVRSVGFRILAVKDSGYILAPLQESV